LGKPSKDKGKKGTIKNSIVKIILTGFQLRASLVMAKGNMDLTLS